MKLDHFAEFRRLQTSGNGGNRVADEEKSVPSNFGVGPKNDQLGTGKSSRDEELLDLVPEVPSVPSIFDSGSNNTRMRDPVPDPSDREQPKEVQELSDTDCTGMASVGGRYECARAIARAAESVPTNLVEYVKSHAPDLLDESEDRRTSPAESLVETCGRLGIDAAAGELLVGDASTSPWPSLMDALRCHVGAVAKLVVIRTDSKDMNTAMAGAALRRGMQLHAHGVLEVTATGEQMVPQSEREVLERLGVPYREPAER